MNLEKIKSVCCSEPVTFVAGYPRCTKCEMSCKVTGDYMDVNVSTTINED